jgi:hypothetical protein
MPSSDSIVPARPTIGLQETSDPWPKPLVCDRLGIGFRDAPQISLLLLALGDHLGVLFLGCLVLLDDISKGLGQVRQDGTDIDLGIRGVSDLGLERMKFDRILSDGIMEEPRYQG